MLNLFRHIEAETKLTRMEMLTDQEQDVYDNIDLEVMEQKTSWLQSLVSVRLFFLAGRNETTKKSVFTLRNGIPSKELKRLAERVGCRIAPDYRLWYMCHFVFVEKSLLLFFRIIRLYTAVKKIFV